MAVQGLKIAAPSFIIPFMFVYNPAILLENAGIAEIVITLLTTTFGVLYIAIAGAGYSFHKTALPIRIVGVAVLLVASFIDYKSKGKNDVPAPKEQ